MGKKLLSWIAFNNDFIGGEIDTENSPNYLYHKYFYNHDKHILLSSAKDDDLRAVRLQNKLQVDFPEHLIEVRYMDITDVIGLNEIKTKVESFLLELPDNEIDIFFSPGTSIMQLSWYICHTSLGLKTRLFQTKPSKFTESKEKPELLEISVSKSSVPYTSILKEKSLDRKLAEDKDFLLTDGIRELYKKAEQVAQTDRVTVLIKGESGTGKEHLASFIHKSSARKQGPFVTVNCSAFNEQLLESRLFGYKKGAFTGAEKDTKGLFEEANKGSIFLDEIGDISPYMQQSLLRVMQEKEIQPVGGVPKKVDVRIIAATNKNLLKLCAQNKFRWDLFYRLAVAELEVPGLLERGPEDIKALLEFFINRKQKDLRKDRKIKLSNELRDFLLNYEYPGNVREMENLIETLYVFDVGNELTIDDLPSRTDQPATGSSLKWKDVERELIRKVLKIKGNNLTQAQKTLGYGSINTLKNKIKEYCVTY